MILTLTTGPGFASSLKSKNVQCSHRWRALNYLSSFKQLHLARAGPDTARRFLEHLCSYARTVGKEAELRERDEILDIRGYIALRREIGGVKSCFDLVEYCLDINLPQEIYEDPVFVSGYNAAMDQITWSNVWLFPVGTCTSF